MRLPAAIPLSGVSDIEPSRLLIGVYTSEVPPNLNVSLLTTCQNKIQPCLLGSFIVDNQSSASALRDLKRHQERGDRITLAPDVRGYLLEATQQTSPYGFSTMMWQQGGMIYTISFSAIERQNLLFMAQSMVNGQPIYRRSSPPTPSIGIGSPRL
ncbi:MAG: hypothetical protein KME06_14365 [Kastovskya adunca ATA6-11-RM4]|jgi:hypothetical protein|nr:hypothetical protein [Kastovskya adunca ATA6-11-RM4]